MTKDNFQKIINRLKNELASIRTGRAMPMLVENIEIETYGAKTPLKQLASISVPEAKTLVIQPWDRNIIKDAEKGLRMAGLDLNPAVEGNIIRINFPPLTEEKRTELVKIINKKLEEARVSLRREREEIAKDWKQQKQNGTLSEDVFFRQMKELQTELDQFNEEIKQIGEAKEKEIMTV